MTNKDRANKIKKLLGLKGNDNCKEYYRVADVLCDLMHYCNSHQYFKPDNDKIDFDNEYNKAIQFYNSEK